MANSCIFCDGTSLTKEHVFPQWLIKELDIEKEKITPTHTNAAMYPLNTRKHTFSNLVNGNVCRDCNNGWMSELENDSIPILKRLINITYKENLEYFSNVFIKNNSFINTLIRWLLKTAITLNNSSNYRLIIPSDHYEKVYKNTLPDDLIVNFAYTNDSQAKLNWIQTQGDFIIGHKKFMNKSVNFGYKIVFKFNNLLVKLVYNPFDFEYNYYDEGAIQIYPQVHRYGKPKAMENLNVFNLNGIIYKK